MRTTSLCSLSSQKRIIVRLLRGIVSAVKSMLDPNLEVVESKPTNRGIFWPNRRERPILVVHTRIYHKKMCQVLRISPNRRQRRKSSRYLSS